uniref:Uncharacterized protein n=1 Tax=Siphoviridae sp. ctBLh2 TaxID=2827803 RepID=A0A8S5S431_9CAUD|nr:MAG TPA: hypothetical protein [Siphoviridae sp. ctBLh2]
MYEKRKMREAIPASFFFSGTAPGLPNSVFAASFPLCFLFIRLFGCPVPVFPCPVRFRARFSGFWPCGRPGSADDDGVYQPDARPAVDLFAERLPLVEEFRAQDTRLDPHVEDVVFEPQFGGQVGSPVADDCAPRVGQAAFGHFSGDVGAFEELLEQVTHEHGFRASHCRVVPFSTV